MWFPAFFIYYLLYTAKKEIVSDIKWGKILALNEIV